MVPSMPVSVAAVTVKLGVTVAWCYGITLLRCYGVTVLRCYGFTVTVSLAA